MTIRTTFIITLVFLCSTIFICSCGSVASANSTPTEKKAQKAREKRNREAIIEAHKAKEEAIIRHWSLQTKEVKKRIKKSNKQRSKEKRRKRRRIF